MSTISWSRQGADPKQSGLSFDWTKEMRPDEKSGDLMLATAGGAEPWYLRPKV